MIKRHLARSLRSDLLEAKTQMVQNSIRNIGRLNIAGIESDCPAEFIPDAPCGLNGVG